MLGLRLKTPQAYPLRYVEEAACHGVGLAKTGWSVTTSRGGRGMPYRMQQPTVGEKFGLTIPVNLFNSEVLFIISREAVVRMTAVSRSCEDQQPL